MRRVIFLAFQCYLSLISGFLLCSLRPFRLLTSVCAHLPFLLDDGSNVKGPSHVADLIRYRILKHSKSNLNCNIGAGFHPSALALDFYPEN